MHFSNRGHQGIYVAHRKRLHLDERNSMRLQRNLIRADKELGSITNRNFELIAPFSHLGPLVKVGMGNLTAERIARNCQYFASPR